MQNLFAGLPQQGPTQQQPGQMDDVKEAVAQLMAQQQANEPAPRPPTPQEADQIKQTVVQQLRANGALPAQGTPSPGMTIGNQAPPPQQEPPVGPPRPPGMDGMGNPMPWVPGPAGMAGTNIDPSKAQDGKSGVNWGNAFDLMLKTNPATAPQYLAGKWAQDQGPGSVLEKGKKLANIAGDVTGSGQIFNDEPKPLKAAAEAKPVTHDEGPEEPATSEADEGDQIKPKGETGTPEHEAHLAKEVAPEARKVANSLVASGVDNPDKADIAIRSKFHDDPELEKAISEARTTYDQLRQLNNEPPTVVQYIGAILLGMAGAGPHVISNILHPGQALNAQREGMAGESLLKLQLAKAGMRGKQMDIQAKQGEDSMAQKRLDQQMSIFQQREGDQQSHQKNVETRAALEKARDSAATDHRHFMDLAGKSVGAEKKKNLDLAEQARQKKEMFGQMLGEPTVEQMRQKNGMKPSGSPQSMAPQQQQVSPSAMRLLGIGNA